MFPAQNFVVVEQLLRVPGVHIEYKDVFPERFVVDIVAVFPHIGGTRRVYERRSEVMSDGLE